MVMLLLPVKKVSFHFHSILEFMQYMHLKPPSLLLLLSSTLSSFMTICMHGLHSMQKAMHAIVWQLDYTHCNECGFYFFINVCIDYICLVTLLFLSLYLSLYIVCDDFSHGWMQYNRQDVVINGSNYTIFIPERCVTGSYARLCNDETHHPGLANDICTRMGFACEQFSII